ncbi:MAG: AAA family ATPase, partial [Pseudomonadota bacterium]|nr:AAA family ATPase [Pseudomonadota bacterium]
MTVLTIMIQLAETLTDLHQHDIIHKDIKPANIIVNLATQEIRLIDFSISAQLNFDHQTLSYPTVLEGSLTYLAPEQTGRMNCPLDARTDLYSLGIVFYELLMGHPPFRSIDAVDLIHSHLAKQPIPPHILKPQIPALISDIIMKLLAKTPEARYQSAYGLKRDLQKCQQQLQTQDKLAPFTLAQEDITPTLHLPLKLYGREAEIKILVDTLRRIKQGHSAILFIKAAAGMGKTALVQELQRVVVQQGGFFISGKFEQFQTIPYSGFFQALRELVHQILTLSEEQIVTWKTALQQSLGANIQVIIDFLPELTLIVEPQAPVESLPFVEHQNRFYLVFQKFIQLFGRKDQPLVLFLDDMHWADHATLKLIQTLMTDRQALWLIGAYRDNELNVTHPLTVLQTQLQESDIPLQELQLMSLELGQINALVSDSLHCPPSHSLPLAELIIKKTAGNPFFIHEFLKTLYHQQLLQFNRQNRIWYWDVEAIQQCAITDNVVELMIKRIETLPESTQTVLKLAACLGNQFELTTLALIYEHSPADTLQALWVALEMGLCLPSQHSYHNHAFLRRQHQHAHPFYQEPLTIHYEHYRFLHDRIQQAAYCLISETEKPKLHYQIGQLLYQYHVISEGYLFEIVNHLNKGQSLIKTAAERQQLAQLNLHVGRKAKMTNAYANAVNYLKTG